MYQLIDKLAKDDATIDRIEKTARVVARLYALQLEEVDKTLN